MHKHAYKKDGCIMPHAKSLFTQHPFAGDDGSIAPDLERAFRENRLLKTEAVVAALGEVRVLIGAAPHAALSFDANESHDERSIAPHKTSVHPLDNPDGLIRVNFGQERHAYAIFSSAQAYESFAHKYSIASAVRPVPIKARDTAALALARGDGLLVLDPDTPHQQWIGRSACMAIATGDEWCAPWDDPEIAQHIMGALPGKVPGLERVSIDPGEGGSAFLTIYLIAGSSREQVAYAVQVISEIICTEPYVKARLDLVELRPFWGGM